MWVFIAIAFLSTGDPVPAGLHEFATEGACQGAARVVEVGQRRNNILRKDRILSSCVGPSNDD